MADMDEIIQAGTATFRLEDVKVTFSADVDIDVSGVRVKGRQGEIVNLPRYVADVLESEKHAEIQDTDMVVELKQAMVKENVQDDSDLATLDPHFYIRLRSYMRRLSARDAETAGGMLNKLVRKRQGKIVGLADSLELNAEIAAKLTIEERAFYESISANSRKFKDSVLGDTDELD